MAGFVVQQDSRAGCVGTGALLGWEPGHLVNEYKYPTGQYIRWNQALLVVPSDRRKAVGTSWNTGKSTSRQESTFLPGGVGGWRGDALQQVAGRGGGTPILQVTPTRATPGLGRPSGPTPLRDGPPTRAAHGPSPPLPSFALPRPLLASLRPVGVPRGRAQPRRRRCRRRRSPGLGAAAPPRSLPPSPPPPPPAPAPPARKMLLRLCLLAAQGKRRRRGRDATRRAAPRARPGRGVGAAAGSAVGTEPAVAGAAGPWPGLALSLQLCGSPGPPCSPRGRAPLRTAPAATSGTTRICPGHYTGKVRALLCPLPRGVQFPPLPDRTAPPGAYRGTPAAPRAPPSRPVPSRSVPTPPSRRCFPGGAAAVASLPCGVSVCGCQSPDEGSAGAAGRRPLLPPPAPAQVSPQVSAGCLRNLRPISFTFCWEKVSFVKLAVGNLPSS